MSEKKKSSDRPAAHRAAQSQTRSAPQARKCPICGKPAEADGPAFPFCSARCRTLDLGKWLDGSYVISRPVEESDLDEGE